MLVFFSAFLAAFLFFSFLGEFLAIKVLGVSNTVSDLEIRKVDTTSHSYAYN